MYIHIYIYIYIYIHIDPSQILFFSLATKWVDLNG